MLLELGDAEIGVTRFEQLGLHALNLDHGTGQRHHARLGVAFAHERQRYRRIGFAPHALDGIVQAHALHIGFVELDDQVARLEARAPGRCILDRCDDLDEAIFHSDFDAQAAEFPLGADLQIPERLDVQIGGVRIQARKHAVDGFGDQLLVVDRFDIVVLDATEDLGERA